MSIDKAKGIICKPMPRYWHDRHSVFKIEDEEEREFNKSIVAEKKPYFMRYIYPQLMRQYNTYIRDTNKNCLREFGITVKELSDIPDEEKTEHQREFLRYYDMKMPVGVGNCVMNKICRRFEDEFDNTANRVAVIEDFDHNIMRSDYEYSQRQANQIKSLYEDYNKRLVSYSVFADYERIDESESASTIAMMNEDFKRACSEICPDEKALCNIVLDICYTRRSTKRFAWNMCAHEIIGNLLQNNGGYISYLEADPDGDVQYGGSYFSEKSIKITEVDQ